MAIVFESRSLKLSGKDPDNESANIYVGGIKGDAENSKMGLLSQLVDDLSLNTIEHTYFVDSFIIEEDDD